MSSRSHLNVRLNDNSALRGSHAELSPSSYHWLNYDEQKMRARLTSRQAARLGTRKHNWAHEAINLGIRQKENSVTIYRYINDGIRYRMKTDFIILVSEYAYGEADCLSYRDGVLRIHDLKTGITQAKLTQLELYAAYFCLEYDLDPLDIQIILQIYQNDQIIGGEADPNVIKRHMIRTKEADRQTREFYKEVD